VLTGDDRDSANPPSPARTPPDLGAIEPPRALAKLAVLPLVTVELDGRSASRIPGVVVVSKTPPAELCRVSTDQVVCPKAAAPVGTGP
jgi:hypothetical protein